MKDTKEVTNIEEIIASAPAAQTLGELITSWNYISDNKYQYSVADINRARDAISSSVTMTTVAGEDADKAMFYMFLQVPPERYMV